MSKGSEVDSSIIQKIINALMNLLGSIPKSTEDAHVHNKKNRCDDLTRVACLKCAALAGTAALPPGPMGLATILPEMIAIWRVQQQLVSDIASVYGKTAVLTKEAMLYCLFKHASARLLASVAVNVGGKVLLRRVSLRFFQNILKQVAIKITQRTIAKGLGRWLPIIGSIALAAYAAYETNEIGKNAIELFSKNISIDSKEIDNEEA